MRIRKNAIALVMAVAATTIGLGATEVSAGAVTVKHVTTDWSHCLEAPVINYDLTFYVKWGTMELPSQRACSLRKTKDVTIYDSNGSVLRHKVRNVWLGLYVDTPNATGNTNQFECTANPITHYFDGEAEVLGVNTQRLQRTEWETDSWCVFKGVIGYEGIGIPVSHAYKFTRTMFGTETIYMITQLQTCNWDKTNCGSPTTLDYRSKTSQGWVTVQGQAPVQVPLFGPNGKPPLP
jgi:hypothetical protein